MAEGLFMSGSARGARGPWGEDRGSGAHLTAGRLTHSTGAHRPWQNGGSVAPKGCVQAATGPGPQEGHRHCLRGAGACRVTEKTQLLPRPLG